MKLIWTARLCALILAAGWQAAAFAGDMVLIHGHIYTGNPGMPWVTALAVKDARIEAVGSDADVLKHRGHAQVIDLHGETVIPGIVDSHTHVLYGAYALHGMNLSTPEASITPEKPELFVERLKAYAAAHPHDAVLFLSSHQSTPGYRCATIAGADLAIKSAHAAAACRLGRATHRLRGHRASNATEPVRKRGDRDCSLW